MRYRNLYSIISADAKKIYKTTLIFSSIRVNWKNYLWLSNKFLYHVHGDKRYVSINEINIYKETKYILLHQSSFNKETMINLNFRMAL